MSAEILQQPVLVPVEKPVSLIPVGLKEAALDSPTFRATAVHYSEQIDAIEKWLESYVTSASKLTQEVTVLEGVVNSFLSSANPPDQLSEAVLDHDYTLLAIRRYGEGAREFWSHAIGGFKKTQFSIVDPINAILRGELRSFKELRRQLDSTQRNWDTLAARYFGQLKTKEASSLREDAFQLHEARKSYLRVSMEFCVLAPQLRSALDSLLIKVFSDQWLEMKDLRETTTAIFSSHGDEVTRIRAWSQDMRESDKILRRELIVARKQIEESAEIAARPSRELDDYSVVVPSLGAQLPAIRPRALSNTITTASSKQGWLYMRTQSGKPARTTWVRRWFFVKNGICGWLVQGVKSGGVEESEKVGVLLCSVRVASQEDRRFCFEVKTKDTTIILQSETQGDMQSWLSVFELAKKKALETPLSLDSSTGNNHYSSDAAFAVSPAVAPELAAKRIDGQIASINEDASTRVPGLEDVVANRASFDLTSLRRPLDKDSGHGRDQRLAVPAQSSSGPASSSPMLSPSKGGLANLIHASHSVLMAGSGRRRSFQSEDRPGIINFDRLSTLAPTTFANPPNPTNLSRTAVMVGVDRGVDLGPVDSTGGMPGSLMANQWGTANYGHLSRMERGEIDRMGKSVTQPNPQSLGGRHPEYIETLTLADSEPGSVSPGTAIDDDPFSKQPRRMTASEVETSSQEKRGVPVLTEYPDFYPKDLRVQDAQMRMIFPNIAPSERAVLVFQASWTPDGHQEIPGRAYATTNNLYFYSNHMGFVLVSGVSLSSIIDISVASDRQQDIFYLRAEGLSSRSGNRIVAFKTFLEPTIRLRNRLNYLVSNANLESPAPLQRILQDLVSINAPKSRDRSPGSDRSWQNASPARAPNPSRNGRKDIRTGLRVDHSLFGGDAAMSHDADVTKFKLPTQAVTYAPRDMTEVAVETDLNVSAKALFHIMFGDKSLVSQMLYFHRRAKVIKQYPWATLDENHWTRNFEYHVNSRDIQGDIHNIMIVDSQTVDVANDHLCYVVTDRKSPWHLPHPKDFSLVTKIVITHVAKSTSKLALYTKVEWFQNPGLIKAIIDTQGLDDLRTDAKSMVTLVSDQVSKLGPNCHTKRAITIFGNIGQSVDANQLTAPDTLLAGTRRPKPIVQRSLPVLVAETSAFGTAKAAISLLDTLRTFLKPLTAHTLLLSLLSLSVFFHLLGTTEMVRNWWTDRAAANLMSRLGIGPDTVMSRAVYLSDMYDFTTPTQFHPFSNATNECALTFHNLHNPNAQDPHLTPFTTTTSTSSTTRRLHRARQHLGTYRHDLLISLRLVNSVERETVRAEYANWLVEERAKCAQVGGLLESGGGGNGGGIKGEEGGAKLREGMEGVREWWGRYCGDCGREWEGLGLEG